MDVLVRVGRSTSLFTLLSIVVCFLYSLQNVSSAFPRILKNVLQELSCRTLPKAHMMYEEIYLVIRFTPAV